MPKIPYVAPKIYNATIFSVRLQAGQAPGYATNCTCLADWRGPCVTSFSALPSDSYQACLPSLFGALMVNCEI